MKSKDLTQKKIDARQLMADGLKNGDEDKYNDGFEQLCQAVADGVRQEFEQRLQDVEQQRDTMVLATRGVQLLTSQERDFYQKLIAAMGDINPKQALANMEAALPTTTVDKVFEDLKTQHPLLKHINFQYVGAAAEIIMNENGYQCAAWGELTDTITKELLSGFRTVATRMFKLTAFLPVAKAMLDLGPQWMDRFVRETLYEAYANGLEVGIVAGDGKNMPIGMNRQIGTGEDLKTGITITDGKFPEKAAVKLDKITPTSIGAILANLAKDGKGKDRNVENVLFICNPADYYSKVFPATTTMAPDGTYRKDVMPWPMEVIPTPAQTAGKAIIGLGNRYAVLAGLDSKGRVDYSDHVQFLNDNRVYLVKGYANGLPMDNNAFVVVNIADLEALMWVMAQVSEAQVSEA